MLFWPAVTVITNSAGGRPAIRAAVSRTPMVCRQLVWALALMALVATAKAANTTAKVLGSCYCSNYMLPASLHTP